MPSFSLEQMQSILVALPDPAFILTRSGRYAAIFGGTDARYYHSGDHLIGQSMADVLSPEKTAWFLEEIETALTSGKLHVVEYALSRSDVKGLETDGPEHSIWFEGRVQALDFSVHGEDAVLWVASNVTARNELAAQLRRQSETDALTGLSNRRKLMDALSAQHKVFQRYGVPMTLLIFDIDHFKTINDTFGHMAGDRAIIATADVCRRELRATDFAARLGGDEFVVLMPHTPPEQAGPIAERLRLRVAEALHGLDGHAITATISGGLSGLQRTDASFEDVLKRADAALYQAKRSGRNRIAGVPPALETSAYQ